MGEIILYETVGLKAVLTNDQKQTLRDSIRELKDSIDPNAEKPTLMVRVDATHAGWPTGNNTIYEPQWMSLNSNSWTDPFEKPVLAHHDKTSDAIGRVKEAIYIDTSDSQDMPKGHIQLMLSISDSPAIEKIIDERYSTVSIGASSSDVHCNICKQNLAEDGLCSHQKGKEYEDDKGNKKKCNWLIGELVYREVSFVNTPADTRARVTGAELIRPSILNSEDAIGIQYLYDSKDSVFQYKDMENSLAKLGLSETKLTAAAIKKLPESDFCGPNRSFPVPNEEHAAAALSVLNQIKLSFDQKGKIRAHILAKARKNDWNLGKFADTEEGNYLSKKVLDKEDLKFLDNFWVGCSDVIPKKSEDAEMFIYAHNLLHRVYDELKEEEKDNILDLHLEIHQFIHSHKDHLKDLKVGPLDDILPSKKEGSQTDDLKAENIKCLEDTFDLTDKELEKIEKDLPEELQTALEEAKLTTAARKKLPGSAFCGPDRSFPAHDAAHVRNALARLPQATRFTPAQKSKILACLRRRAKSVGVKVSSDGTDGLYELQTTALHEACLDDILALAITQSHLESIQAGNTITQNQYEELLGVKTGLEKSLSNLKSELEEKQSQIVDLKRKLDDQQENIDSILDENQGMQRKMHLIVIDKVIDKRIELKRVDTKDIINAATEEERATAKKTLREKYTEKSSDSLRDMLTDLDDELASLGGNGNGSVSNPGVTNSEDDDKNKKKITKKTFASKQEKVRHILGFDDTDKGK